jgi:hypothetical protein
MKQLEHPYGNLTGGRWLRGNLHAHTTRSDGTRPQQEVIDDYARRGFNYLMLSDHDVCTAEEDYKALNPKGLILIPGNEVSAAGPHLLHVHAESRVEPDANRQKVIDDIRKGRGFAVMNHPNWHANFNHCSIEKLQEWSGYQGIEVFNGVIGRLDGSPYATNKWDMLLNSGRKPCWGYANDDSHREGDLENGLGWNTVYVRENTCAAVVDALRNGRFYPSTGVTITKVEVEGMRIRIETENAERIVALQNVAKRIATSDAKSIEVTVPENAKYVRFECWGRGEKFAWTQPFWVTGE